MIYKITNRIESITTPKKGGLNLTLKGSCWSLTEFTALGHELGPNGVTEFLYQNP